MAVPTRGPFSWASTIARSVAEVPVLARAGLTRPLGPITAGRSILGIYREGIAPAAAYEYAAARYPDEIAIIDDRGSITFAEMARRIGEVAAGLGAAGVQPGDRVAILCRNHRGFVLATAALASIRADIVYLNVSSSPDELSEIVEREGICHLIHDEELSSTVEALDESDQLRRFVPWKVSEKTEAESLEELTGQRSPLRHGSLKGSRYILLTSGTTGISKSAARGIPFSIDPIVAICSRVPVRVRDVTYIASPLFHAWGFANMGLSFVLSSTVVLSARFDPEEALRAISQHRVRVMAAVPVMLQKMVDLSEETRRRYDTSSLEIVVSSGSALPGDLATEFMDAYGDVLYNLYGSTEAAWASIATPEELRLAPGTAGRPPHGTELRIVDDDGIEVPRGETGRVLVKNGLMTTAGPVGDEPGDGFFDTGDLGHLDAAGLLHIDGRSDDMIVSGGENVYPREVEEVILGHEGVKEAAVVGVADPKFGQRLRAVVVKHPGAEIGEEDVKEYVRNRLARFKVPREVVFVDELVRNEAGKTLRRVLGQ